MKSLAVVQSNYIPWKGYFDLISRVDECLLYDNTQYTPRSWRNRNRIKTPSGSQWLVIPVLHDYQAPKRICDTLAVDDHWRRKHWKNLLQHYAKAPYFATYKDIFEPLYLSGQERNLSDINYRFLTTINAILGIATPITRLISDRLSPDRDADIIALCKQFNATIYVSGPLAQSWLDEASFQQAGIHVEWMHYEHYPKYMQFFPPFEHAVSILDLIFHTGPAAARYIRSNRLLDT